MDSITIKDLEIYCNHGVYPEETKLGQKFLVTCTLSLETRCAGKSDRLEDSVDYGAVCHLIDRVMKEQNYKLIEAAAEKLAEEILVFDERIQKVDVQIKKPWAPIGLPLDTAIVNISRQWHEVFIAMGSNIGDKEGYLNMAVTRISEHPQCRVEKISKYIETDPYGGVEQDRFLNGAMKIKTLLFPYELLEFLNGIEGEAKRERIQRWGPRTLDLDILFYDDLVICDEKLCIPHVDMKNRIFVLEPMAEIAPYKRHPVYGETMSDMLKNLIRQVKY